MLLRRLGVCDSLSDMTKACMRANGLLATHTPQELETPKDVTTRIINSCEGTQRAISFSKPCPLPLTKGSRDCHGKSQFEDHSERRDDRVD